jgi:CelD/BcsL family acetyltransferase involved in cellulose biosynthesis
VKAYYGSLLMAFLSRLARPWSTAPLSFPAPAGSELDGRGSLRVEPIRSDADLAALTPAWEALDASLRPRTPFSSPLWNTLWWQHYRSETLTARDELLMHAVYDEAGSLVAVAPMMLTNRPAHGPLRARMLHSFGADPNVTELRGLVCRPEDQGRVVDALLQHYADTGCRWSWLNWGMLREDGTWPRSIGREDLGSSGRIVNYHLDLPATWEELRASRSRNIKESIRKCYNSLKREGHTFRLRVVESPQDCPEALAIFFALHSQRAQAEGTVSHVDVFREERHRRFLGEVAATLAARGKLRIFQLEIGGSVVATRIGFVLDDELYLYYSGYNLAWGRFSVMTTLVTETIKWAIEQRFARVNLSTGSDVSKLRWGPSFTPFRAVVQVSRALPARLAYAAYRRLPQFDQHSRLGHLVALVRR